MFRSEALPLNGFITFSLVLSDNGGTQSGLVGSTRV